MKYIFCRFPILPLFLICGFVGAVGFWGSAQAFTRPPIEGDELYFRRDVAIVEGKSGRHAFQVEIAENAPQRAQGLMYRKRLGNNEGMLFIFDEPSIVHMWMKDTPLPLDMIFVASNGRVLRVAAGTTPYSEEIISSGSGVLGVLEIKGGRAAKLGIRAGDRLRHDAFTGHPQK